MRRGNLVWLLLILLAGGALFFLKFRVQELEGELVRLNRELLAEQEALHVLSAEWSYLSRPDRLAELSRRHLELQPLAPEQLVPLEAVPVRPPFTWNARVDRPGAPLKKLGSRP